jgi:hypothetical protein
MTQFSKYVGLDVHLEYHRCGGGEKRWKARCDA